MARVSLSDCGGRMPDPEELKSAEKELLEVQKQIRTLTVTEAAYKRRLEKMLTQFWTLQTGIRLNGFMACNGVVCRIIRFAWTGYRFDPEKPPQVVCRRVMRNLSGLVWTKNENKTVSIGTALQANSFADALDEAVEKGLVAND